MGNEIRIGFMGFSGGHSPVVQVKRLGSAVPIAIDKLNENALNFGNVNVSYEMVETACEPKKALGALVELVKERNISVLIGPSCGNEKEVIGLLASQWNTLTLNYGSSTRVLTDKVTFDTLMNLGGNFKQTGDAFRKIIAHMQAENICSYLPFPKGHNVFIEEGIMEDTETENITILGTFLYDFYSADPHKLNDVLKTIKTQCRGKILFHVEYANFVYFVISGLGISSYYII